MLSILSLGSQKGGQGGGVRSWRGGVEVVGGLTSLPPDVGY